MAKSGKRASNSKKKSAKKAKTTRRKARSAPSVLTAEERQRVTKPREGWRELLETVVETWRAHPGLKIAGLTPSKAESAGRKADKAADKERNLIAAQQLKLRPISDARLIAEGAAWDAILEVNRAVKYHGKKDPALLEAFSFLADAFSVERSAPAAGTDET